MAKDFKHRTASARKPAPRRLPTWAVLTLGFGGGLAVALAVHLHHTGRLDLWAAQARPWGEPSAAAARRPVESRSETGRPRPRFEFYSILPEMEVVVPEREVAAPRRRPTADATPERYILQAGSFRHVDEADRLKASLALLGLEADIQTVSVNGADTWHRVRLGPFRDMVEVQAARERLRENRISAMVLKIRI